MPASWFPSVIDLSSRAVSRTRNSVEAPSAPPQVLNGWRGRYLPASLSPWKNGVTEGKPLFLVANSLAQPVPRCSSSDTDIYRLCCLTSSSSSTHLFSAPISREVRAFLSHFTVTRSACFLDRFEVEAAAAHGTARARKPDGNPLQRAARRNSAGKPGASELLIIATASKVHRLRMDDPIQRKPFSKVPPTHPQHKLR
jgi:hypothetical protein